MGAAPHTAPLTGAELALWHAFKRAAETVRARIAAEITAAAGLSDADFGIVTRLQDAGGRMLQRDLAASMDWHRSRLSHQLSRMTDRDLVRREDAGGAVLVELTAVGLAAADRARPIHAAAVRTHLTAAVPQSEHPRLTELLRALAG
jgi:DNA-binding MarR family transcriptional regulator